MSKKFLLSFVVCASALSAAFTLEKTAARDIPQLIVKTDFMSNLNNPWDLAFTSDGTMFFTEKCIGLSVRDTAGTVTRLFGTNAADMVAKDILCQGQSGVNGIALDPNFATNFTIFVYTTSTLSSPATNRVVRLELDGTLKKVLKRTDIVEDIPFKAKGNNWGGAGAHSGGRIRFGMDGYLYVTTGDNHNGYLPQDLTKLAGKVLRVDRDGKAAPDNNTPAGGDARIYTYGHRNVQGITFNPATGQAIVAEHGPGHSDEVTALVAGGNAGWDPKPEQGVSCADDYCGYTSNKIDGTPTPMTDLVKFPQAMPPILSLDDSEGMGPITFLTGPQWKDFDGQLVVGIMGGKALNVVKIDNQNKLLGVTSPQVPQQRPRSLVQGPDGFLYVATDEGAIWQIQPQ